IDDLTARLAGAERAAEEARAATAEQYEARLSELFAQLAEADRRVEEARQAALAEQQATIDDLTARLAGAERAAEEARAATAEQYEARLSELFAQLAEADRRVEEARQAALAEQQAAIDGLTARLADAERAAEEARAATAEQYEARLSELSAQLAEADRRVEEARQAALAEQQDRVEALAAQLAAAGAEAGAGQQALIEEQQARIAELTVELAEARQAADAAQAEAEERAAQAREAALAEDQSRIEELSWRVSESERRAEEATATCAELEARASELARQLDEAQRRVQEERQVARAEFADSLAGLSAKLADLERRSEAARETALAEQEITIRALQRQLEDAEQRVAEARAAALAEQQTRIDDLLGQLRARERMGAGGGYEQTLLDGIPYPVFLTDPQGRVVSCNAVFARVVLGLPLEQILGRELRELGRRLPSELLAVLERSNDQVLLRGGEEAYEATVPCADGQRRVYALRKEAHRDPAGQVAGVACAMMDISGLQAVQQALEEERRHSAGVLSRTPAVIAEIRADGTTAAVYGACEEILGYPAEELVGRNWWKTLFPGELFDQLDDALGRMRSGLDLEDTALVVQTREGERRTLSWTTANTRSEDRELVGILAVGYDITERAQAAATAQRNLTQANERVKKLRCLSNVLRLTQDTSLTLNEMLSGIASSIPPAWTHTRLASARIRVWDREREAGDAPGAPVARQSADIIVNGEVAGEVEVRYHKRLPDQHEGPFTAEERHLLDLIAERIGETVEQRSAEESLAKLQQFRHTLIDQAGLWMMALDRAGSVVLWNRAAEEISGYAREEVVGHDAIWELLYPDEDLRAEVIRTFAELVLASRILEAWDTVITRKDGTQRVVSFHARKLIDDEGMTIGSVAVGRDVTEERARGASAGG
ncbi:MAG: PAS domain S-box protein, partial [Armatimonadota bacterium]